MYPITDENTKRIAVAVVEDQALLRNLLCQVIAQDPEFVVSFEAANGADFINRLVDAGKNPDVVLLDINMPVMNGFETAKWLQQQHPEIAVLVLSMFDDEMHLLRMLYLGCRGYLPKNIDPAELIKAIREVVQHGWYFNKLVTPSLLHRTISRNFTIKDELTEREKEFINLACSELTYKGIAAKMGITERAVDGHREHVFFKLDVKSRVGMVLYALSIGLIHLDDVPKSAC